MKYIFDIETDSIDFTKISKIHCIVIYSVITGNIVKFYDSSSDGSIKDAINILDGSDIIGHNIVGYDIPVIKRFFPEFKPNSVFDTYIVSRMFYPDRVKGHSLESWSNSVGGEKVKNDKWDEFNETILHRCINDVKINYNLYRHLIKEIQMFPKWKQSIRLEHKVAEIMTKQAQDGWLFDLPKSRKLVENLYEEISKIDKEIDDLLPLKCIKLTEIKKPFKKDGDYSDHCKKYVSKIDNLEMLNSVSGSFSVIDYKKPDLNSPVQMKELLYTLGWKPTEWNYKKDKNGKILFDNSKKPIKMSPKLTLESYDSLPEGLGQKLAYRAKCSHRLHQIEGLIKSVREDGRIEAKTITCGTNTARMTHQIVVNIPKAKPEIFLGTEMRSLFICPKDKVLVGCDCSGLEWRIASHYLNNQTLIKMVTEQDIHTYIQDSLGLKTRQEAKNLGYAILYGAGSEKVSKMLNVSIQEGGQIRSDLIDLIPNLKEFLSRIEKLSRRGYLIGLDGRKIFIRNKHSAFNALIQSAGSIIEKLTIILINKYIKDQCLNAFQVGVFHDEHIYECEKKDAEKLAKISRDAIIKSGQILKLRTPLDGEAKIGKNWGEVH